MIVYRCREPWYADHMDRSAYSPHKFNTQQLINITIQHIQSLGISANSGKRWCDDGVFIVGPKTNVRGGSDCWYLYVSGNDVTHCNPGICFVRIYPQSANKKSDDQITIKSWDELTKLIRSF